MKPALLNVLPFALVSSFTTAAQSSSDNDNARLSYYVSLMYSESRYEIFYPSTPNYSGIFGPQVVVGWQLNPRLAAQVGFGYMHTYDHRDPSYTGTTVAGLPTYGTETYEEYKYAFPVLLRYSLVPHQRPTRTQFDVVGGVTSLYAKAHNESASYVGGQLVGQGSYGDQATQFYFTGGFGIRYLFRPRFEGVFDATWSRNMENVDPSTRQAVSGSALGLTSALSLGLRYRFNLPRRATAAIAPAP